MAQSVCLFSLIILLVVFGYVSFALNLNISSSDDYSFKVGTASNSVTMVTLVSILYMLILLSVQIIDEHDQFTNSSSGMVIEILRKHMKRILIKIIHGLVVTGP